MEDKKPQDEISDDMKAAFEAMLNKASKKQRKRKRKGLFRDYVKPTQLPLAEMIDNQLPQRKRTGKHRSQDVQAARKWWKNRNRNRVRAGKKEAML